MKHGEGDSGLQRRVTNTVKLHHLSISSCPLSAFRPTTYQHPATSLLLCWRFTMWILDVSVLILKFFILNISLQEPELMVIASSNWRVYWTAPSSHGRTYSSAFL